MEENVIDVLFISGSGRSGSTLLEQTLNQTGVFASIGELRHIWYKDFFGGELCSCGETLKECPFWSAVMNQAFGGADRINFKEMIAFRNAVDRVRFIPRMIWPDKNTEYYHKLQEYQEILLKLYRAIKDFSGKAVVIDSSKDISSLYLLRMMPELKLHVLHLVRDSRAVAFSWQRQKARADLVGKTAYMRTYKPLETAWQWDYRNFLSELSSKLVPDYKFLRYEEFIISPRQTIESILNWFGFYGMELDFLSDHGVALRVEGHSVSGNPNRFIKGTVEFRLDDEWVRKMKKSDKDIVTLLTLPYLMKYGYLSYGK